MNTEQAAAFCVYNLHSATISFAGNLDLTLGYDAGVKGAFASVTGVTNVSNKDARATATWFQKGNHVRTEASIELDGRSSLWGT